MGLQRRQGGARFQLTWEVMKWAKESSRTLVSPTSFFTPYLTGFLSLFFFFKGRWFFLKSSLIYGCTGPALLLVSFLLLQQVGATVQLHCRGFSLQKLVLLQSMGSRAQGASVVVACGLSMRLVGSRAQAQQLWLMG